MKKYASISLLILFFFVIFSYHTIYRHKTYSSHAFDLGIYTQVTYLYSQGLAPLSTLKHMNLLGDHFGPILFILSPFYKLFPTTETLLIIQAFFVSLSGVFIYKVAIDKTKDRLQSIILTFAYLSAPGIFSAVNFDFHLATISVLPLSIMLYTWYFKKWKLYILSLFFALLFKEDIPIFIVGLGLFSLIKKQIKIGLFTIILGILSFYIIKFQIMPYFSAGAQDAYINSISQHNLFSEGKQSNGLFMNLSLDSTTKIHTLVTLYGQFLFLPLLSALSWLTVFPYLVLRFSSSQAHYFGTHFHYNANLAPFLVISLVFALSKITVPKYLINTLLILAILVSNLYLNNLIIQTLKLDFRVFSKI